MTSPSECYVCGAAREVLRRHYQRDGNGTRNIYSIPVCMGCVKMLDMPEAQVHVTVREPTQPSLPLPETPGVSW